MNFTKKYLSILFIILSNFFPLACFLYKKIDFNESVFLYFIDFLVIGIFVTIKISLSKKIDPIKSESVMNSPKEASLYYLCIYLAIVIFASFTASLQFENIIGNYMFIFYSIAVFLVSRGFSFLFNFVFTNESETHSPKDYYVSEFPRLGIIIFLMFILDMNNYLLAFISIYIIKTLVDLYFHLNEHGYIKSSLFKKQ